MRLLFGIILGVFFTISGAYIYDTAMPPSATSVDARPMVNWDVVSRNWQGATTRLRQEFAKLTSH